MVCLHYSHCAAEHFYVLYNIKRLLHYFTWRPLTGVQCQHSDWWIVLHIVMEFFLLDRNGEFSITAFPSASSFIFSICHLTTLKLCMDIILTCHNIQQLDRLKKKSIFYHLRDNLQLQSVLCQGWDDIISLLQARGSISSVPPPHLSDQTAALMWKAAAGADLRQTSVNTDITFLSRCPGSRSWPWMMPEQRRRHPSEQRCRWRHCHGGVLRSLHEKPGRVTLTHYLHVLKIEKKNSGFYFS